MLGCSCHTKAYLEEKENRLSEKIQLETYNVLSNAGIELASFNVAPELQEQIIRNAIGKAIDAFFDKDLVKELDEERFHEVLR